MTEIFNLDQYTKETKMDIEFIEEIGEDLLPSELVAELDNYIVGQEQAKKLLAITVVNHQVISQYNFNDPEIPLKRSNLLLAGPSGSGKTYLVETMAKILNKTVLTVDITHYTQAGYKGKDVNTIINDLFNLCSENPEKAAEAIIFIDEIDKIGTFDADGDGVSTTGVQRELLRLVDGGRQFFDLGDNRKNGIEFDTSNILWIFGGSFNGYLKSRNTSSTKKGLGFVDTKKVVKHDSLTHEELIEAGLTRELVGRIGNVALLHELSREDFLNILIKPVNSQVKQAEILGKLRNINLKLTPKELNKIVDEAIEMEIGARGLKVALEQHILDKMYI